MSGKADLVVRTLAPSDAPRALELSTEAGWNQTENDWRLLISLAPNGCLGIEADGQLASTATLVCYGRQLAWVGMVLTRTKYRGRGFAKRLLTDTLRLADEQGIETVKLDATDEGRPLYEKLGFRGEQLTERWVREAAPGTIECNRPGVKGTLGVAALRADATAFGANRSELLHALALRNAPIEHNDSYVLARAGRVKRFLGPCVAQSQQTAQALVQNTLRASTESGWYWDLLPENTEAVELAQSFGFGPSRRLLRMVRGKELRGHERRIYALAGFELG